MEFINFVRDFFKPGERLQAEAKKFFASEEGQRLQAEFLEKYGVKKIERSQIYPLFDSKYKPGLKITVREEDFKEAVRKAKPKEISYDYYWPDDPDIPSGTRGELTVREAKEKCVIELYSHGWVYGPQRSGILDLGGEIEYDQVPRISTHNTSTGKFVLQE